MKHAHLGALIRRKRKELHLRQKDLADRIGVTAPFIANLEKGKISLPFVRVKEFCKILDAKVIDFCIAYIEDYKVELENKLLYEGDQPPQEKGMS